MSNETSNRRSVPENPDRADWMAAAAMGGMATTPFVLSVVGWASSWNAYTNLMLMLGSFVLWLTLWTAWKDAA